MERAAVLKLVRVSKDFATQRAVDGVSLEVAAGEFFSLLGPSGCGKTTVLRMVAGFERPSAGEVWLDGARIDSLPPYERNVNTVFQSYALFPHLTVDENVAFGLRRKRVSDAAARVAKVLDLVRLSAKAGRKPHELSGGERQRVALARAIVLEPGVLLLDEPLSALDPKLRKQLRGELRELQRRVGITFVFVTHDQEEALSLSDRIGLMNGGRLEQTGTPQELYARPATRFAAEFLGAMNWIGGVGVRPEAISLAPEGGREAVVTGTTYLGSAVHIEARLAGGEVVVAQVAPGEPLRVGDRVALRWATEDEVRVTEVPGGAHDSP